MTYPPPYPIFHPISHLPTLISDRPKVYAPISHIPPHIPSDPHLSHLTHCTGHFRREYVTLTSTTTAEPSGEVNYNSGVLICRWKIQFAGWSKDELGSLGKCVVAAVFFSCVMWRTNWMDDVGRLVIGPVGSVDVYKCVVKRVKISE